MSMVHSPVFVRPSWAALLLSGLFVLTGGAAVSAQSAGEEPGAGQSARNAVLYCQNNAVSAADARASWQAWKLISLEARLAQRIEELARREVEFEAWVERREEMLAAVEDQVVTIIARMRPEAAAAQLATTDDDTAVGVLLKLKARQASGILDEMDPGRAAQLTQTMVGISDPNSERSF
ncbi:hypothetical protein GCM10011316_35180 [Roseibium aquae]|uniref:Flagellar motility protein MotE (MotC chaperone) n=1 Tax=Roseibium aquae TaxID=1323746 RepID=A0A916TMR8_9HYPH|nr:MotE family protein [Roseibium aquae]GGB60112.1 hypothetical protein GCM10011316_35180 [Roseibium aquae]